MNEFNKDCTFDHDDVLNRRNFANNLTQIIKEGNKYTFNNSLVIALDSPWGTGKTTFINKWISAIREDKIGNEKMEIIHYNAWDNDDWNEPLVSLLNELETHLKYIAKKEEIISDLKKTSIRLLKYIGKNVTQNLIEKKFGIDTDDIFEIIQDVSQGSVEINNKDELEKYIKINKNNGIYNEFKEYKKLKDNFKKIISEISKKNKVIFFVDELDRCRPTFAIETLEIIKHLFNLKNITFVLAIDMEQLSHSIATIYGQNMDSTGYLRRFFDLNFKMPLPSTDEYINYLITDKLTISEGLKNQIIELFDKLKLTLRDMNSIFLNILLLFNTSLKFCEDDRLKEVYVFLLVMKYKYIENYKIILYEKFKHETNTSNDGITPIEDKIWFVTDNVKEFMDMLCSRNNLKICEVIKSAINGSNGSNGVTFENCNEEIIIDSVKANNLNLFIDINDLEGIKENEELLNQKVSNYIERKLELFSYEYAE